MGTAKQLQDDVLLPMFRKAEPSLLAIYNENDDNRKRQFEKIEDQLQQWKAMDELLSAEPGLHDMQRDGLCHEAVMWFVHHLTEASRKSLVSQSFQLPLLPTALDQVATNTEASKKVAEEYSRLTMCSSCHVA